MATKYLKFSCFINFQALTPFLFFIILQYKTFSISKSFKSNFFLCCCIGKVLSRIFLCHILAKKTYKNQRKKPLVESYFYLQNDYFRCLFIDSIKLLIVNFSLVNPVGFFDCSNGFFKSLFVTS